MTLSSSPRSTSSFTTVPNWSKFFEYGLIKSIDAFLTSYGFTFPFFEWYIHLTDGMKRICCFLFHQHMHPLTVSLSFLTRTIIFTSLTILIQNYKQVHKMHVFTYQNKEITSCYISISSAFSSLGSFVLRLLLEHQSSPVQYTESK